MKPMPEREAFPCNKDIPPNCPQRTRASKERMQTKLYCQETWEKIGPALFVSLFCFGGSCQKRKGKPAPHLHLA